MKLSLNLTLQIVFLPPSVTSIGVAVTCELIWYGLIPNGRAGTEMKELVDAAGMKNGRKPVDSWNVAAVDAPKCTIPLTITQDHWSKTCSCQGCGVRLCRRCCRHRMFHLDIADDSAKDEKKHRRSTSTVWPEQVWWKCSTTIAPRGS